jgi:hypothetical protein
VLYLKLHICIGDELNAFALFGLALKLGFRPLTKAVLVAVLLKTRALLSG